MLLAFFTLPLIIFLDQVTKAKLATSCNSGIAFSLFSNAGVFNIVPALIIVSVCFYFLLKQENKTLIFSLALIAGGGLSNIFDRLTLGCVRDFINFGFWPSFNLADGAVIMGIVILVYAILTKTEAKKSNDSNH